MRSESKFPLGDGLGCVECLWIKGDDLEVVNDARESFEKEHEMFKEPDDARLIRYLAAHNHWTPFAGSYAKFRIKMPIFVAREWYRHTIGFNRNEVSRRYVTSEPDFFTPAVWRKKPEGNIKQGSGENFPDDDSIFPCGPSLVTNAELSKQSESMNYMALHLYNRRIAEGVAPEQARIDLPQNMYTECRESASLYAYARLCKLRIAPNAQYETRMYAEAVASFLEPAFPVSWKELMTHE